MIKTLKYKDKYIFALRIYKGGFWFRLFGYGHGLNIRNTPKLFSERHGYKKALRLPFRYRVSILKPVEKGIV
jgi:hypothetical protein